MHRKFGIPICTCNLCLDVMKPLQIEQLMDQEVVNLSGGELQRVVMCLCLGKVILLFCLIRCFVYMMHSLIGII
jgi:translation initiation factor RLI1